MVSLATSGEFNALGLDAPVTIKPSTSFFDPQVTVGSQSRELPVRRTRRSRAAHGVLVRQRPQAADAARHRSRRSATAAGRRRQRPDGRRREGRPHVRRAGRACRACCRWSCTRVQAPAEDASRASPATTPTGCRPARAARRRAATSSTARGSPSSSCSARSRCGPARSIKWDADGMKATNVPDAQPIIEGSYRKGWELPV